MKSVMATAGTLSRVLLADSYVMGKNRERQREVRTHRLVLYVTLKELYVT